MLWSNKPRGSRQYQQAGLSIIIASDISYLEFYLEPLVGLSSVCFWGILSSGKPFVCVLLNRHTV